MLLKGTAGSSEDARYHSALALRSQGGQGERGIQMAVKGTELLPHAKDDVGYGIMPLYDLAVTYILLASWTRP